MTGLRISEIFFSLQGETRTVGWPTVFVRLTGCPLRCSYCDTTYAFRGGEKRSLDAVMDEIRRYRTRFVTVTGGEPLAQKNCLLLLDRLAAEDFQVSLETSGALDISDVNEKVVVVMDLKTPSSGEAHKNRYENIEHLDAKDQVKFVISDALDYEWSKEKVRQYSLADRCEVLFSPNCARVQPVELADRILHDQLPVRFQIQLHKHLWGDVPGK